VHGIVESLYRRFRDQGLSETDAYRHSVDSVTGPISRTISKDGLYGLYQRLDEAGREAFGRAYAAAYPVGLELTHEIYDEVSSGNEIRSVIMAGKRFARFPMGKIDQASMWRVGEVARRSLTTGSARWTHPWSRPSRTIPSTTSCGSARSCARPWTSSSNERPRGVVRRHPCRQLRHGDG
jgi:hypothetical protein